MILYISYKSGHNGVWCMFYLIEDKWLKDFDDDFSLRNGGRTYLSY